MLYEVTSQLIALLNPQEKESLVKTLTADQYVENVNRMMDMQNSQTNIWLTIIGVLLTVVTAIFGFYTWKVSKDTERKITNNILKEVARKLDVEDISLVAHQIKGLLNNSIDAENRDVEIVEMLSNSGKNDSELMKKIIIPLVLKNNSFFNMLYEIISSDFEAKFIHFKINDYYEILEYSSGYEVVSDERESIEKIMQMIQEVINTERSKENISEDYVEKLAIFMDRLKSYLP